MLKLQKPICKHVWHQGWVQERWHYWEAVLFWYIFHWFVYFSGLFSQLMVVNSAHRVPQVRCWRTLESNAGLKTTATSWMHGGSGTNGQSLTFIEANWTPALNLWPRYRMSGAESDNSLVRNTNPGFSNMIMKTSTWILGTLILDLAFWCPIWYVTLASIKQDTCSLYSITGFCEHQPRSSDPQLCSLL